MEKDFDFDGGSHAALVCDKNNNRAIAILPDGEEYSKEEDVVFYNTAHICSMFEAFVSLCQKSGLMKKTLTTEDLIELWAAHGLTMGGALLHFALGNDTLIDRELKDIMKLKDTIGEFSVDLYYNDCVEDGKAYTAKVHSAINEKMNCYAREGSFLDALYKVREYLESFKKQKS